MDVVAVIETLRGLSPSERLAHPMSRLRFEDVFAAPLELVDLLLEAPPSSDDFAVFHLLRSVLPAARELDVDDPPAKWVPRATP